MRKLSLFCVAVITASLALVFSADPTRAAEAEHVLKIVAAGDSITQGAGASAHDSWPAQLRRKCAGECRVLNTGRGGSCLVTEGCADPVRWIDSFEREVLSRKPDVVAVALGRNDLCHATTPQLIAAYRQLRSAASRVGAVTHFATITPAGARWQWPCEQQRREVNRWLRRQPGTLDFERAVIGRAGLLRRGVDCGDGLHLNKRGYRRMARVAYNTLVR